MDQPHFVRIRRDNIHVGRLWAGCGGDAIFIGWHRRWSVVLALDSVALTAGVHYRTRRRWFWWAA